MTITYALVFFKDTHLGKTQFWAICPKDELAELTDYIESETAGYCDNCGGYAVYPRTDAQYFISIETAKQYRPEAIEFKRGYWPMNLHEALS